MRKIKISQIDCIFANGIYPIEFLFYFKAGLNTKRIKSALSILSSTFWPLFGEYKAGNIYFDKYSEIECFSEEELDQEFDTAGTSTDIYGEYRQTNPTELKKLFYLKVIQYKNGTVLIPKMNHLAGDGYSYFYFLSSLAALSRSKFIPFKAYIIRLLSKPHHHRTILKEFVFRENVLKPMPGNEKFTITFEKISRQGVWNAKNDIASKFNQRVSTNDIISAIAFKKSVILQKEYFGNEVQLTIPIDVRRQIDEYGQKYFGNGIVLNTINFKTKSIENSSANEIAIEIRKSMPSVSKDSFIKYLEELESIITKGQIEKLKPFDPRCGCLITNLSKLPADKLNFGGGLPDLIFPLTVEKNSVAILADKDNYILRYAF